MKGPYERLKYNLRRVWDCPVCKHRERTDGDVTYQYCRCQQEKPVLERVCMRLVKDGVRQLAWSRERKQHARESPQNDTAN